MGGPPQGGTYTFCLRIWTSCFSFFFCASCPTHEPPYDALQIRKLESELDIKLVSYSKFGVSYAQSSLMREDADANGLQPLIESSSEHVSNSMAVEIEQLLKKVRCVHSPCVVKGIEIAVSS